MNGPKKKMQTTDMSLSLKDGLTFFSLFFSCFLLLLVTAQQTMSVPDAVFNQTRPDIPHGSWIILGVDRGKLFLKATGCGVDSLRDTLDDTECSYVLLGLRLTLQEIPDQLRQIFIQWKGPKASGMAKVKANQLFQQALDCLSVCVPFSLFLSFCAFSALVAHLHVCLRYSLTTASLRLLARRSSLRRSSPPSGCLRPEATLSTESCAVLAPSSSSCRRGRALFPSC